MTTLISVHNSDGLVGRCDAHCHDAKTPAAECKCVCGGRNHGVGKEKAIENTREMAETMLSEYAQNHQLSDWKADIPDDVYQMNLFEVLA